MQENKRVEFNPVKKKFAYEVVYESLKDQILSGALRPGDKLKSERDMMDIFGFSHPTIREALGMLEKEGLIRIIPGSGAVVVELSAERIKHQFAVMMTLRGATPMELSEYRSAVSVEYTGWAAKKRTAEDIENLKGLLEQMKLSTGVVARFFELDAKFHSAIISCAYNAFASLFSDTLDAIMKNHLSMIYHGLGEREQHRMISEIINLHQQVVGAIADRDEQRAKQVIKLHLEDFRRIAGKKLTPPGTDQSRVYGVVKASQAIYDQIYSKIIMGEMSPGDRLPSERALMEMFQRSRPPVREGLRMLESEGYITVFPGSKGAIVNKVTTGIIERPLGNMMVQGKFSDEELMQFRVANDTACIGWAVARRTQKDIDVLSSILERMKKCKDDASTFFQYDLEFHIAISKSTHNSVAYIVSRVLVNMVFERNLSAIRSQDKDILAAHIRTVTDHHERLLSLLIAQQEGEAKQCVISHVDGFRNLIAH